MRHSASKHKITTLVKKTTKVYCLIQAGYSHSAQGLRMTSHKESRYSLDEIFRGTNNIESVAVTAAVVSQVAAHSMVVMSSHNLVLAPLLESHLEALRIMRYSANQLAIESGVLVETNGINMMKHYNIQESVFENAKISH